MRSTRQWPPPRWLVLGLSLAATMSCRCDRTDPSPGPDGVPPADSRRAPDAGPRHITEIEPNDRPDRATTYERLTVSPGSPQLVPFAGELSDADDVDYIRIPGSEVSVRALHLKAPQGDVALVWPRGEVTNLRSVGEGEELANFTPDEAVIGVKALGAPTSAITYELTVSNRSRALITDVEAGDGQPSIPVALPGDVQGLMNYGGDRDVFRLDLAGLGPNRTVRVEARAPAGCPLSLRIAAVGTADALLSSVVEPSSGEAHSTVLIPNLQLPAVPVELELSQVKPTGACRDPYLVRVHAMAPVRQGEVLQLEPDSAGSPLELVGSQHVVGFVHGLTDRDYFSLAPADGQVIRLTLLSTVTSLDVAFPARWKDDQIVHRMALPTAEPEILTCNRPLGTSPTPVEIRFGGAELDSALPEWPIRYRLDVAVREPVGEELEPNGGRGTANTLTADESLKAYIFPPKDVDVFKFTVGGSAEPAPAKRPGGRLGLGDLAPKLIAPDGDSERTVSINLDDPGWDLVLEVQDGDGEALGRSDRGGTGDGESVVMDLPPGEYLVRVHGKATAPLCETPYVLNLTVK